MLVGPSGAGGALAPPLPVKRCKSASGLDAFKDEAPEEDWGWFVSFSKSPPRAEARSLEPPATRSQLEAYERRRAAELAASRYFGTPAEAVYAKAAA